MRRLIKWFLILGALVIAFLWWRGQSSPPAVEPTGSLDTRQVLLIPGYGGDPSDLTALREGLQNAGYTVTVVNIGDGEGPIQNYADQLANQASSIGGAHLVGYSQGGLIARAATSVAPAAIGRVITIATPHAGTTLAGLGAQYATEACGPACQDMAPGSEFLSQLPVAEGNARWLAIRASGDDVVRPADSAMLAGATNLKLESVCSNQIYNHTSVVTSQATIAAAVGFLQTGIVLSPLPCP